MTRDEYLLNHDAHEGAEEETTERCCPICGSDECEVYAVRDGEIVGCDCCVARVERDTIESLIGDECLECGSKEYEEIFLQPTSGERIKVLGCDRCIREVERWEWEAKA